MSSPAAALPTITLMLSNEPTPATSTWKPVSVPRAVRVKTRPVAEALKSRLLVWVALPMIFSTWLPVCAAALAPALTVRVTPSETMVIVPVT